MGRRGGTSVRPIVLGAGHLPARDGTVSGVIDFGDPDTMRSGLEGVLSRLPA
ncbi:hypothetical protein [Microbispora sp. KK1-11]|uniref:hypothetical protein n=1 Tax=Microbispora sp. KK1-11 TaxID=2053005 RepID=UPI00163C37F8|nr:hypothetical protein [Microbispora sp. KK1-11]